MQGKQGQDLDLVKFGIPKLNAARTYLPQAGISVRTPGRPYKGKRGSVAEAARRASYNSNLSTGAVAYGGGRSRSGSGRGV